jgi:hypothetical protein
MKKLLVLLLVVFLFVACNPIPYEIDVVWGEISFDNTSNTVTITSKTSGGTIYYSLDGSTPTESSNRYTAPFPITDTTTIKAIEVKDGVSDIVLVKEIKKLAVNAFVDLHSGKIELEATEPDAEITYTITYVLEDAEKESGTYRSGIDLSEVSANGRSIDAETGMIDYKITAIARKENCINSDTIERADISCRPVYKVNDKVAIVASDGVDKVATEGIVFIADRDGKAYIVYKELLASEEEGKYIGKFVEWGASDKEVSGITQIAGTSNRVYISSMNGNETVDEATRSVVVNTFGKGHSDSNIALDATNKTDTTTPKNSSNTTIWKALSDFREETKDNGWHIPDMGELLVLFETSYNTGAEKLSWNPWKKDNEDFYNLWSSCSHTDASNAWRFNAKWQEYYYRTATNAYCAAVAVRAL